MVLKRQCSFCAGEVEPGTGTMFVKRDGSVFYFCTSSCRKQQMNLGRVGHRLKWTRAHALKRAAEASGPAAQRSAARAEAAAKAAAAATAAPATPAKKTEAAPAPAAPPAPPEPKAEPKSDAPAVPAKKPRAKKPKATGRGST
jgi:large subunit ribosomal protein L24e